MFIFGAIGGLGRNTHTHTFWQCCYFFSTDNANKKLNKSLRHYMQYCYLLLQKHHFVVIAAFGKFQQQKPVSPVDLPAPACYLQFLQGFFCVARSRSNMLSAPWWDEALPDMCLKSQGLLRLSDMCQKSPASRGLPTPPQTAAGTALPALSRIADITLRWQISTKGSHLLLRCQM